MIRSKYLIIIFIVICLVVIYYLYKEIKNCRNFYVSTHQKYMKMQSRIDELEILIHSHNSHNSNTNKKNITKQNDSPALSITYQSDMIKNGNLSVKYADLSDTEAQTLLKAIERNSKKKSNPINSPIKCPSNNVNSVTNTNGSKTAKDVKEYKESKKSKEESDTINIKLEDLIKKSNTNKHNLKSKQKKTILSDLEYDKSQSKKDNNKVKSDNEEYLKILNGLTTGLNSTSILKIHGQSSENVFESDGLENDVIRSMSESIKGENFSSEYVLSEIPEKVNKTIPIKSVTND